jgi:hypothetical protein
MLTRDHLPILQRARVFIENEDLIYICNAVAGAAAEQGRPWGDADPIIDVIQAGLDGVGSRRLEVWLAAQPGLDWRHTRTNTMYLARLAWLDKLIHDLETK